MTSFFQLTERTCIFSAVIFFFKITHSFPQYLKNILSFTPIETSSIWLNGSGYIVFNVNPAEENFFSNYSYVAFHLKTENSGGIIFSLQSPYRNDYLLVEMTDGKIRVELDLGEGN